MRIACVNAGSSSLKLSLIDDNDRTLAGAELAAPRAEIDDDELAHALHELGPIDAVAHRVVHGGTHYRQAVLVDATVMAGLEDLRDLAPLHQPKSLAGMRAVTAVLGDLPAVACFDTAFHLTLPPEAHTYALPQRWRERWGLRRYGFHGLSHAWVARRVSEALESAPVPRRIVSCHLGAGASLCAIHNGQSIDTTMGFTPLEGLVMATRSGSVDPGMLLWLLEREALTEPQMAAALEHDSGLAGLAGTADMEKILERTDDAARLAVDVYVHRLHAAIAAMTAALGGVDVLVFTGGVGENSPEIRARAAAGLEFLGVRLDQRANAFGPSEREIGAADAPVRTLVLPAREDLEMARQARGLLSRSHREA